MADIIDLLVVALLGVWVLTLVVLAVKSYFKGKNLEQITYDIRISLGRPILLSLELLIVSDVLHSIASRTLEDLGIVATVVVIRVFMAYFLDKELERLNKQGHAPQ
ncbi:DUF1622 domain-containing protein [Ruegeria denitrificans]|uniref:DUF1622 domain-containing protein n=1 Tax=Ruegeria denitrificans TaxID=1715692 RepID=UPI0013F4C016|nr:DUF1622 domain-containing protein [Ruegeria denitrificans]